MYPNRRLMLFAAGLALAVVTLGGCAALNSGAFLARGADLHHYRTYNWASTDELYTGDPRLDNNEFFLSQLKTAVEKQMAAKGFERVDQDTPAMTIHYHASVTQKLDVPAADQKYAECNGCGPFVYDAGSLVLDLVDARTDKLLWRGWAEGSIDGDVDRQARLDQTVDDAVAKIFALFPAGF